MEIIKELSVFNDIKYYDEPHKYYIDGQPTISCTGFIHKFSGDFESGVDKPDKWAQRQGHFYEAKSMADKYAHKQNFYPVEDDPYGRPDYSKPKPQQECVTEEDIKDEFEACLGALKIIKDGWETEAIPKPVNKHSQKNGFLSKIFGI